MAVKEMYLGHEGILTLAYGAAPHLQIKTFTLFFVILVCLGNTMF